MGAPRRAAALLALGHVAWTPTSIGHVDSLERPIRCHYEYAESAIDCGVVIEMMEAAWEHQVDVLGWAAPEVDASSRVGIYLTDDGTGGDAYADCASREDNTAGDGRSGCVAFVALDYRVGYAGWRIYAGHEFNHVLQYSADFNETAEVFWEGAAAAIDLWQPDPQPVYVTDTRDFQSHPWVGLLGDGRWLRREIGEGEYYEYGGVLWWMHLAALWGDGSGQIAAGLWAASAQEGLPNEPDVLEGYEAVTGGWRAALLAFAEDRARLGTEHHPAWADYTMAEPTADVSIGLAAELTTGDLPAAVTPEHLPFETGAVYARLEGLEAGARVSVEVEGDPGVRWGVVAGEGADGAGVEGASLTWESGGGALVVGAVNLGRPDIDADPDPEGRERFPGVLEAWDVTLRLARVEADDPGDTGGDSGVVREDTGGVRKDTGGVREDTGGVRWDTGEARGDTDVARGGAGEGDGKGCGCASAPALSALSALLPALVFARRRRSVWGRAPSGAPRPRPRSPYQPKGNNDPQHIEAATTSE